MRNLMKMAGRVHRKGPSLVALAVVAVAIGVAAPAAEAASCESKKSGVWSDSGNWKNCGGNIPADGDSVSITDAMTLDTNSAQLASLTVTSAGAITDDGVATRRLRVDGPLSNAGTINLYSNSSAPSYIQIQQDSLWSGNGTITANYIDLTWKALTLNVGDTLTIVLKNASPLQNVGSFNSGGNRTATLYLSRNGAQTVTPWNSIFPNLRIGGTGTKTVLSGSLTILGGLTVDSGTSFDASGSNPTTSLGGNLTIDGTFNAGTGVWTFSGTSAQTISAPASFQSLTLNNSAGLSLGGDLTIGNSSWGTLTLQAGRIATGSNKVVIPRDCTSGWLSRTAGSWINGNLSLQGPTWGATCIFHVGDASNYAPITFTYPWYWWMTGGTVIGSTAAGDHADTTAGTSGINAAKSVNRTWTLTLSSGSFSSYDATFQFCNGTGSDCGGTDVDAGASTSSFIVAEKSGSTWSAPTTSTLTTTSSKATGITNFGTFAVGEAGSAGPLAYYAMDEGSWNGTANEVVDGSGNGHHGRAIGSATTVSGGKVCRGASIASNSSDSTQYAVDTGLDVDGAIGSKGTISFWYKSRSNWNGGGDRTLLDASSSSTDKYFSLILQDNGRLRFALEDSADDNITFDTSQFSFTSSDWVHIAVTWDMPGDRREIYVNGSLAASDTDNRGSSLGNLETLYIGDNRSTYHPEGSPNSANGFIDEVYVYRARRSQSEIQADMTATHTCSSTSTCVTFRDEFASTSYSRNDGTANWTGSWTETGDNGSASNGTIQISSNRLQLEGDGSGGSAVFGGPSIEREANLSAYTSATLSFDYSEDGNWESSDSMDVWVSKDGGANWVKIQSFQNDQGSTMQAFSYDMSAYIASNFRLAFVERANNSSEVFYIDNVQIEACAPTASLDHVRLEHSGAAVTCMREPVTIKACQDSACTTQYSAGSVSLTLSPAGGWYDAATGGTASDSLSFTGSATRYLQHTTAETVTLAASGVTPSATNGVKCYVGAAENCSLAFSSAGFVVSSALDGAEATIPAQVAATGSASYYLRAVKTNTSTKACEAALSGSNTVNFAYECLNPGTCYAADLMAVNGGTSTVVARNASGAVSSYTAVAMTFDGNGNALFTFNYSDVGQVKLHMAKAAGGSLVTSLSGSSNAFVVKPSGFVLSDIKQTASPYLANPGAATAAGDKFVKAGEAFSATVTAKAGSGTAYSFGREATAEDVVLSHALVEPSGGATGSLTNGTVAGSSFSAGVAAVTNLSWSEIGIITLTPANSDYLGEGAVTGTVSGNIGRFYPDHFDTEVTHACSGTFTYSGQPFPLKVTAKALGGGTTTNYAGAFAKTVTFTDANGATGTFNPTTLAATDFTAGVADKTATPSVSFAYTNKPSAPTTLKVRAADADSNSATGTEGTTPLRFGRLRISNAFGSEKSALELPVQAQYWSADSWVINSSDSCTSIPVNAFALSGGIQASTGVSAPVAIAGGNGVLRLTAPNTTGSVDIAPNLGATGAAGASCLTVNSGTAANLPWLRSRNGSCTAATNYVADPSARATFGIYTPETRRTVHVRETF